MRAVRATQLLTFITVVAVVVVIGGNGAGAEARGPFDDETTAAGAARGCNGGPDGGGGPALDRRGDGLAAAEAQEPQALRTVGQQPAAPSGEGSTVARKLQEQVFYGRIYQAPSPTGNPVCAADPSYCVNACPSLWYRVVGTGGPITASSCGEEIYFDQIIWVFEGSSCSSLTCIGATRLLCFVSFAWRRMSHVLPRFGTHHIPGMNDDGCGRAAKASVITFPTTRGALYHVMVTGYNGATGSYPLTITGADAPVLPSTGKRRSA